MTGRKVWVADEVLSAEDLNGYLMDQVVPVFSNATARDSSILTPFEGQLCYVADSNIYQAYSGSAWVDQNSLGGTATAALTAGTATYATNAGTATRLNGITIFNSSTTPTANATGDLWFY